MAPETVTEDASTLKSKERIVRETSGLKVVSEGKLTAWGQSLRWLIVFPIWFAIAVLIIQAISEQSEEKGVVVVILGAIQLFWMCFPTVPIRTFAVIAWVFNQ